MICLHHEERNFMALNKKEAPWEVAEREQRKEMRKAQLSEQYGPDLGEALANSSLEIGSPADENLAKALLAALTAGSPEQQLKAVQAILAYARSAGKTAAHAQSRHDNSVY